MCATIPSNTLTLMWKSACTWILRGRGSLTTTFVLTLLLYSWINKHRKEWSEQETVGSLLTQECCDSRYMPISLIAAQHLFFFFFFSIKKIFLVVSGRSSGEGNGYPLHYSAWRIPWTEEPGELQSMGSQGVRHDGSTNAYTQHVGPLFPNQGSNL